MCTYTQCACACACACACVHACACAYGFMLCMHVHVHVRMHRVNCQLRYRMYGVCMPRLAPPSRLRCIGVRGTALRVDLRATTLRYGFTWLLKRFYFMFTPSRGCFSAEISVRVRPSRLKGRYRVGVPRLRAAVKFSNKCCADAWSVPSLIMSDMRAPRAGKAFNIHRIRLSAGFALFCPSMGTNKRCLWELASPKVVASAGALA
jgi:hypothetical protein